MRQARHPVLLPIPSLSRKQYGVVHKPGKHYKVMVHYLKRPPNIPPRHPPLAGLFVGWVILITIASLTPFLFPNHVSTFFFFGVSLACLSSRSLSCGGSATPQHYTSVLVGLLSVVFISLCGPPPGLRGGFSHSSARQPPNPKTYYRLVYIPPASRSVERFSVGRILLVQEGHRLPRRLVPA